MMKKIGYNIDWEKTVGNKGELVIKEVMGFGTIPEVEEHFERIKNLVRR